MHMQRKEKPSAGLARPHGITDREYFALGKFSNDADKLGLKTVSIGRGPLLGVGCCLKMSGKADYEVLVRNGQVLLGKVEASGKRVRLAEGADSEATWNMLLKTLEREEKR
jgi:hypothetical protein